METMTEVKTVRKKAEQVLDALSKPLVERDEAVRLAFLSAVAGESIFLLGPPGVGKSLIARRLKQAFSGGRSFEYLMSRFSTPDEIFGPVSVKKLKEEDKYERLTDAYLPGADVVFLDEIWKSGPAIRNALLTVLNEKIYRNGDTDIKVNVRGIIAASNELPLDKESNEPLWDRFLIRYRLGNIQNPKGFLKMITDTGDVFEDFLKEENKLSPSLLDDWNREINKVEIPEEVLNIIQVVRFKLDRYNQNAGDGNRPIFIHDRRWKKIIRLIRTSSYLNGRNRADLSDSLLMLHCLWHRPEDVAVISEFVSDAVKRHGYAMAVNLGMLKKEMTNLKADIDKETRIRRTIIEEKLLPSKEDYFELKLSDRKFEGRYISIKSFNNLNRNDWQVTNFFDENLSLVNRLKSKKSKEEFKMEVMHNSVSHTLEMVTSPVERQEIISKAPHEIIENHWDGKIESLLRYIGENQEKAERLFKEKTEENGTHLFVNKDLCSLTTSNLREVIEELEKLRLQAEKLRYSYKNL